MILLLNNNGGVGAVPFRLPEIDRKATKETVESAFETYRVFKYLEESEPRITAKYPDSDAEMIRGFGGKHSAVESTAMNHEYRESIIDRVERAVRRLPKVERDIITRLFMKDEPEYDPDVMLALGLYREKYYRLKSAAFYKIALALKIAVVKPKSEPQAN